MRSALFFIIFALVSGAPARAAGPCGDFDEAHALQYDLFQKPYSHHYTIYTSTARGGTRPSAIAYELRELGLKVDVIDEINHKLMVRSTGPMVSALRDIPGVRQIGVRYQFTAPTQFFPRTPEQFAEWEKKLVAEGVKHIRLDPPYGVEAFVRDGTITFVTDINRVDRVRTVTQEGLLVPLPPTRSPLAGMFTAGAPETEVLKKALKAVPMVPEGNIGELFDVSTKDQVVFNSLVMKLTELEGYEVRILGAWGDGVFRLELVASPDAIQRLRRGIAGG